MKYILSLLFISSFSFCNAQEIIFSDDEPSEDELLLIAEGIGDSKNLIGFTSNYDDDLVSIFVNGGSIFSNRISTDPLLGSAGGILFDRYTDSIMVRLNNIEFHLKNIVGYRFIYFYNNDNDITIEYRKAPIISE